VKGGNIGREIWPEISELTLLLEFFYMTQICDMGQEGFCFRSEGRHADDFFVLKNPTASAGFEPEKLGYQRPARYL
jgi:hypothetical protein